MILTLDIGNSQIFGAVFEQNEKLKLRFRRATSSGGSSDELGIFLCGVLRENNIDPKEIQKISVCSVVPGVMHSLGNCCLKYFDRRPFVLKAGTRTGLNILYRNPGEVGADRIANAIGASLFYPNRNLILIDFGTAITFCAVSKEREYLGGMIYPGLQLSAEALERKTARLPMIEIVKPKELIGRSTVECIQSGIYYGTVGLVHEMTNRIQKEAFGNEKALVVGTGGFARLFTKEKLFDHLEPELVHYGLLQALKVNL